MDFKHSRLFVLMLAVVGLAMFVTVVFGVNRTICKDFGYFYEVQNYAAAAVARSSEINRVAEVEYVGYVPANELFGDDAVSMVFTFKEVTASKEDLTDLAEKICKLKTEVESLQINVGIVKLSWRCTEDGVEEKRIDDAHAELLSANDLFIEKISQVGLSDVYDERESIRALSLKSLTNDEFFLFAKDLSSDIARTPDSYSASLFFSQPGLPALHLTGQWAEGFEDYLKKSKASTVHVENSYGYAFFPPNTADSVLVEEKAELELLFPNREFAVDRESISYDDRLQARTCFIK